MFDPAEQFFLQLPGSKRPLTHVRRRTMPTSPEDEGWDSHPLYLHEVPSLPEFLVHLSNIQSLTHTEKTCLSNYVRKLALRIKEARTEWERDRLDVVDSL